MTTTAPTHEQQAGEFAAAVRAHLADLPEAELDELLDGLQADLAERVADGGELGDAAQYADELRQAAGLPPRGEPVARERKRMREALRETRIDLARRTGAFWGATPARRAVRDFALSLRPVWWVLRGVVLGWIVLMLFGHPVVNGLPVSMPGLLLTGALVVLSVQWGRGAWAPKPWLVAVRRVVSAVAIVLLLPLIAIGWNAMTTPVYIESDPGLLPGLAQNGQQISNVFAFDCSGRPLDGVQLFDQEGRPITTLQQEGVAGAEPMWGFDEERQQNIVYERNALAGYSGMWNAFPLREARAGMDRDPAEAKARDARWPMDSTLPLSPQCGVDEQSAGEDPAGEDSSGEDPAQP